MGVKRFLFGEMTSKERKKFGFLSAIFFFVVGTYWIVRPLKNALLKWSVGVRSIPMAKGISILSMLVLLMIYTKLIDIFPKHKLFYILCTFYLISFLSIAYFLVHPVIPQQVLGFYGYVLIESFGSLMVALFWSFVATIVNVGSAKRGYALVFGVGQIGAFLGTTSSTQAARLGLPTLFCLAAVGALLVALLVKKFTVVAPKFRDRSKVEDADEQAHVKPGLFEGLKLLLTRPYVLGIFLLVALYEVVVTVLDYQMQILAAARYSVTEYAAFNAFFGQLIMVLSCLFALVGTRFFIKRLGIRACLFIFPSAIAVLFCAFYFAPVLYVALAAMVAAKALSYGFNNPVKETIYVPTSDDVKFKAKGLIDMFGSRSAKGGGSFINNSLNHLPRNKFIAYAVLISLGVIGVWLFVAFMMGQKFNRLVKRRKIIS